MLPYMYGGDQYSHSTAVGNNYCNCVFSEWQYIAITRYCSRDSVFSL